MPARQGPLAPSGSGARAIHSPIDAVLANVLPRLRAKCRGAALAQAYPRRAMRLARRHVVGPDGLRLALQHPLAAAVEREWRKFSERGIDAMGRQSRGEIERLAVAQLHTDGEALIELADSGRVRVIDPAQVLCSVHASYPPTRLGIEFDMTGAKPVSYLVSKLNPHMHNYQSAGSSHLERVAASRMAHIYDAEFPLQSRGIPWLATALWRNEDLEEFESAALESAGIAASQIGIISENEAGNGVYLEGAEKLELQDVDGGLQMLQLPAGASYSAARAEQPVATHGEFVSANLRGVASGVDGGYVSIANDPSGANFSSIRAERLESSAAHRETRALLARRLTQPVFERWLYSAAATGVLPAAAMAAYETLVSEARWVGPDEQHVQPQQLEAARQLRVQLGVSSRAAEIRRMGGDPEQVFAELESERQRGFGT